MLRTSLNDTHSSVSPGYADTIMRASKAAFPTVILVILILIAVEVLVRWELVPPLLLAAPTEIVAIMLARTGYFLKHFVITLLEVAGGFALSSVLGITIALFMASWIRVRRTLLPLVLATQMIPLIAIIPIIFSIMGKGPPAKFVVAIIISLFVITINAFTGFASVDPRKLHLVRAMDATTWQIFREIRLPAALPYMFVGFKIGIAYCVYAAIIAEIMGPNSGLGYVLSIANYNQNMPVFWGGIVAVVIIALCLFIIMLGIERVSIPWHVSQQGRR